MRKSFNNVNLYFSKMILNAVHSEEIMKTLTFILIFLMTSSSHATQVCNPNWEDDARLASQAKQYEKLIEIYKQVEQSDCQSAVSEFNLGVIFDNGQGDVQKNEVEAEKWYRLAANKGYSFAQYNLADMYRVGRGGLAKNFSKAKYWYEKVANQDLNLVVLDRYTSDRLGIVDIHSRSLFYIGRMYIDGSKYGLDENKVEAVKWFKRSTAEQDGLAMFNLAVMYENGEGIKKNSVIAYALYKISKNGKDNSYPAEQYIAQIATSMSKIELKKGDELAALLINSARITDILEEWEKKNFTNIEGDTIQADPALPIKSGKYIFQHRDAEFPNSHGFHVRVIIHGNKVTVINPKPYGQIPSGVIDQAILMWHTKTNQWILGHDDTDREAQEVGGCSAGPDVIDFKTRIIWTCEGGL